MANTIKELSEELMIVATEIRGAAERDKNDILVKLDKLSLEAATMNVSGKKAQVALSRIQDAINILGAEMEKAHKADFARLAHQTEDSVVAIMEGIHGLKVGQQHLKKGQADLKQGQKEILDGQTELRNGQADLRNGQQELRNGQADLRANQDSWGNRILSAINCDGIAMGLLVFEFILALVAGIGALAWVKKAASKAVEKVYDVNLTPIGTVPKWESPFEQWLLAIACGVLAVVIVFSIASIVNHCIKRSRRS